ncbi:MAG: DNA-processing protein DprA [Candidatus Peregrinibacteria bacterium]
MDFETRLFWASLDFLTPARIAALQAVFGDLETARKNFSRETFLNAGIPARSVESLQKKMTVFSLPAAQKLYEKSGATLLFYEDENFPRALKEIADGPVFLFAKGNILPSDGLSLAVVGTRKPSQHGLHTVQDFVPDLVRAGFTIVSGMAAGIDAEAHKTAIQCGGRTIAFWGTGIDVIYPANHRQLAEDIAAHGVVFSEFPMGTPPDPFHFPRRNRLISGFAKGVLVVEGNEKSGSIITAHEALSQGKDVFAVPGNIRVKTTEGPNRLIQKGEAKLVMNPSDILEEYQISQRAAPVQHFALENSVEKKIWEVLTAEGMGFDEIVKRTGLTSANISSSLMMLTLRGAVRDEGGGQFRRVF